MIVKKQEITTAVVIAVIGIIAAYFIFKMILPGVGGASFWNLSSTSSADLDYPNVNVFNYRAINPTIEVYVGNDQTTESEPEPEPETGAEE